MRLLLEEVHSALQFVSIPEVTISFSKGWSPQYISVNSQCKPTYSGPSLMQNIIHKMTFQIVNGEYKQTSSPAQIANSMRYDMFDNIYSFMQEHKTKESKKAAQWYRAYYHIPTDATLENDIFNAWKWINSSDFTEANHKDAVSLLTLIAKQHGA